MKVVKVVTISISMLVGNSRLSLVAALKGCSDAGGVSSVPRKYFIAESLLNLSLNIFGSRNLPVCFVEGAHLSPL